MLFMVIQIMEPLAVGRTLETTRVLLLLAVDAFEMCLAMESLIKPLCRRAWN